MMALVMNGKLAMEKMKTAGKLMVFFFGPSFFQLSCMGL